ncbi:hypothetical protein KLP40_09480 [Hymenobacter sp. NST-14]|uniref:hypothetical protein n=1 Tax=Hymenobacter piscis TaxID=2839984 RepID=UPI001C014A41|nr:hypothetical protein [Hymenobacter piscis]MBT9393393.1 hypothetical protein [Hymenobacter piscis]
MTTLRGWCLGIGLLLGLPTVRAQHLPRALTVGRRAETAVLLQRPAATTLPRQAVRYGWDTSLAAWTNPLREQRTYDAAGRLTQLILADSTTATPFQRQQLSYDARGNLLETVVQTGNGTPWLNAFRTVQIYDSQSELTESRRQTWTGTAWQTTDGFRYQNTYAGAVLTEQIIQLLESGTYRNDSRFAYTLRNGQWTEARAQRWTGTGWENEELITDLTWHDWARRQPAGFRVQSWLNTGQWVDFQRYAFTYGAAGSLVETVEEATAGGWQNFRRFTEPTDARGNDLGYRQEDWLAGAWVLADELRAQLRYDSQNRLTRRTEQLYAPITARFVNRELTNYSDFQTVVTAALPSPRATGRPLRLYPVPATEALQLDVRDLPGQMPVRLEIRDVRGQLRQTMWLQPRQGGLQVRIGLRELPPGPYWLLLRTAHGTLTERFQRQ